MNKYITALLASTSAVGIGGQQNEHLEATYLLNNAVAQVESIGQEAYQEESKINDDYLKELDRKKKILSEDQHHVRKAKDLAKEMMRTPEQVEKDRIAAEIAAKAKAEADKVNAEKAAEQKKADEKAALEAAQKAEAELQAVIKKKAQEMHDQSVQEYIDQAEQEAIEQAIKDKAEMEKQIQKQAKEKAKTMTAQ